MTGEGRPLVSVVTPTRGRHQLLIERAMRGALDQTLRDIEVIVVVDGPDPQTESALASLDDPRLKVIVLPERRGGGEARNLGVQAARSEWIALLDDDDEWLPHKLEQQLAAAQAAPGEPVVACAWITRTPRGDRHNPVRLPDPGESIGDYLLSRKTFSQREGGLVSTLLFARRSLFLAVPFDPSLPRHQDWDWLLRVGARRDVQLQLTDDIAAIWYYEEDRHSVSRKTDWRWSLDWARSQRRAGRLSGRAFVGFLNSHLAPIASNLHDRRAFWPLLRELLGARPRAFELFRYLASWALPMDLRRTLRRLLDTRLRPLISVFRRPSARA